MWPECVGQTIFLTNTFTLRHGHLGIGEVVLHTQACIRLAQGDNVHHFPFSDSDLFGETSDTHGAGIFPVALLRGDEDVSSGSGVDGFDCVTSFTDHQTHLQ